MKVLAVVASRFFRKLLERHLVFLPEPLRFASTIAEANLALNHPVDLICLERHLSDGSGLAFSQTLRRHPETSSTPILLLTTEVDHALSAASMEAGITEVFSKYELERLAQYVHERIRSEDESLQLSGRALLVEDSVPVARFICTVLERTGLKVDVFASGEEAIKRLPVKDYEIALIDILLEGEMTGLSLVRHIRQGGGDKRNHRMPILAMSSMQDTARRIEILRQGANDFLAKPMLEEELVARVRNMVRLKRLLDETEAQRDHLRRLAMTDQLTGLFNRHYLVEIASRRIAEAHRHKIPVSLLVLDIDHFKRINDTHGHDVGDTVLAETASIIRGVCREGDITARTGGEEFVVLLLNASGARARDFAETLRKRVEESRPLDVPVTISIGIAEDAGSHQSTFESLFKIGDSALYQAKHSGRNRVVSLSS
ncbi:diguanylate cyclase [Ectothiorhodospira shaposhnikovii]|uniref:diguanylate cyclase n=1 Tax=Ectothiorhodospira shaposhnikovii TaxID=1054 RepID=UPI001903F8E1|nr:diguanylate cyclase [Ectothiorhodospira shaposhnikovii]